MCSDCSIWPLYKRLQFSNECNNQYIIPNLIYWIYYPEFLRTNASGKEKQLVEQSSEEMGKPNSLISEMCPVFWRFKILPIK